MEPIRREKLKYALQAQDSHAHEGGASGANAPRPGRPAGASARVIVILNNQRNLAGAMNFLERRGYLLTTFNRISDAVHDMKSIRPQVVLLSWNLRYTDIKKVYRLLTETFKVVCIVFAEDNTTRTTAALMSSGIPHSLLAPVSGPSMHMRIQALMRDRLKTEKKSETAPHRLDLDWSKLPQDTRWEKSADESGRPVWKGISRSAAKNEFFMFTGRASPYYDENDNEWKHVDKNASLYIERLPVSKARRRSEVDWENLPPDTRWEKTNDPQRGIIWQGVSSESDSSSVYFFESKTAPTYDVKEKKWKRHNEEVPLLMEERAGEGEEYEAVEKRRRGKLMTAVQKGIDSEEYEMTEEGRESVNYGARQKGPGRGRKLRAVQEALKEGENFGPVEIEPEQDAGGEIDWDAAMKAVENELAEIEKTYHEEASHGTGEADNPEGHDASTPTTAEDQAENLEGLVPGQESILVQALRGAAESCTSPPSEDFQQVGLVSNIFLIPLATNRFKGYVVAALSSDRPTSDLPARVAEELKKRLKALGEELPVTPPVWGVTMELFEFNSWASERAEFVITSPDGHHSACFAFVPVSSFAKVIEAKNDSVLAVPLEKYLVGGAPLLFDLFIHLPKNDKYILYLNKGTILPRSTIEKFVRFGISQVYIRKADRELFYAYCARNEVFGNRQS